MHKATLYFALPLSFVLLAGCGSKNPHGGSSVSGSVTYNSQPLKGGNVFLHGGDQVKYSAVIFPDGTYAVRDVPPGEYIATVETESVNPNRKGADAKNPYVKYNQNQKRPGAPKVDQKDMDADRYVKIPFKYSDQKASPLKVSVKEGENKQDLPLSD
jgi:hypothetical protein